MTTQRSIGVGLALAAVCAVAASAPAAAGSAALTVTGRIVRESEDGSQVSASGDARAAWQGIAVRADRIEATRVPLLPAAPPLKLSAVGNVVLTHKRAKLWGKQLDFDSAKGAVTMDAVRASIKLKGRSLTVSAKTATFHLLTQKIVASGDVKFHAGKGALGAERVTVDLLRSTFSVSKMRVHWPLKATKKKPRRKTQP